MGELQASAPLAAVALAAAVWVGTIIRERGSPSPA